MIYLYLVLIGLAAFCFTLYNVKTYEECQHTFVTFRSYKMKKCVDCGLEVKLDASEL